MKPWPKPAFAQGGRASAGHRSTAILTQLQCISSEAPMDDPLSVLHADFVWCRLSDYWGPVTWSAGDVWITRDEDGWWLDDDRSATEDQVRELLQRARGKVELHGCGPLRPR